jgi:hypothetical protein
MEEAATAEAEFLHPDQSGTDIHDAGEGAAGRTFNVAQGEHVREDEALILRDARHQMEVLIGAVGEVFKTPVKEQRVHHVMKGIWFGFLEKGR